jgi:hypothetical protein
MKHKIFVFVVLILILILLYKINILNETKKTQKEENVLQNKIAEMKSDALASLRNCEANGYKVDDAPIILDSNRKMSIGLYMFQTATIQFYYKTLYNKDITTKQAVLIALDENSSTQLASDILFTTTKSSKNWFNCSKKLKLQNKVDLIKQLEK